MILDDSVARWNGGVDFAADTPTKVALGLAMLCDQIAAALTNERLFSVETLTIKSWSAAPGGPPKTLQVTRSTISSVVHDLVNARDELGAPRAVSVHGHGEVFEPDGSRSVVRDLMSFSVTTVGSEYSVWIETRSDAWLPLTLRDEKQTERYEINAPRLERALTEINESIGLQLVGEPSKYAEVVGFRLANLSYGVIRELIDRE
jgi:hypothetical protein